MSGLVLAGERFVARIVPEQGARVQSLIDRTSSRELLYQRDPGGVEREEFLTCSTGGWDVLCPNDAPWRGFPDHGVVWSAPFSVARASGQDAELRAALARPALEVSHRYALLDAPRRGLHVTTTLCATGATGPFLFAYHPMLAVGEGWRIEHGGGDVSADAALPGRFRPGRLGPASQALARAVPASGLAVSEVLYVDSVDSATVRSPDGKSATRVSWDGAALPSLWVVVVSGELGIDLTLLFEPSTARPFRIDDAIANGTARSLSAGESLEMWCAVESLDTAAG